MEFIHRPYIPGQTVAAIATPPGDGGVAIIRISGHEALSVAAQIFSGPIKKYQSHTMHYGTLFTIGREKIDDVLVCVMRAPKSFTGEDTVEIYCHGGALIARKVLEAAIHAGALAAMPGEFSMKAFLNGKIDLAQAEAIQAKIGAKNEKALACASEQLEGRLSKKVVGWQKRLTEVAAILEAWVDFPEEDLEFAPQEEVIATLQSVIEEIEHLEKTFHVGKIMHEGVAICLVGSPNVGKSSLMNALLGKDRAIVSPIAGTTRDLVEDDLRLGGLHVRLIDTAGIRHTEEVIEEEGIRRSKLAIQRSDIILFVLDATAPHAEVDVFLPPQKTIAIWNKTDLQHYRPLPSLAFEHVVELSAHTGLGLEELQAKIDELIWREAAGQRDEVVITSLRHKEALGAAMASCKRVIGGLQEASSAEFVSYDMRHALIALGSIIGVNITEDILTAVFSKFCIGK